MKRHLRPHPPQAVLQAATRHARRRCQRGLTLIELVVAMAIMAVLLVAAMPYFQEYGQNSRLREAGTTVYTDALLAQSEAIKRNRVVRLATDGASVRVLDMRDPDNPAVLRERTLQGVATGTVNVDFGASGRPTPFGSSAALDFAISGLACSGEVRCPGLRIDAGGGLRLCGNHQDNCS